jgi:inorganic pyrophosphatase
MDYNETFSAGDINGGIVNVVVEVPLGTTEKYEWNRRSLRMEIDRLEPTNMPEPVNYGFIPQTIGDDGDALDVFIISNTSIPTGTVVQARIIGLMQFTDEGVRDNKVVAVLEDSPFGKVADVPKKNVNKIANYFTHYKDAFGINQTMVGDWLGAMVARQEIIESNERWKNSTES